MSAAEPVPKIAVGQAGGVWRLTLSGVVGVGEAQTLAEAARAAVAHGAGAIVIDLARVRSLDTSATQILVSLRRALGEQGRTLRLEGTPPGTIARWRRAGLDQELSLPTGQPSPA